MSDRPSLDDWRELASKDLKGADPDSLTWETPEGIAVKPLYTEDDLDGVEHLGGLPGLPAVRARTPRDDVRRSPVDHPSVRRVLDRRGVQRLLPSQPGRRSAGRVGRLRPRHPPRLRLGPPACGGRRRQGRRGHRLGRGHEDPVRRDPAGEDVGLDDDERRGAAGPGVLRRGRRGAGRRARRSSTGPSRTTSSRSSWSATPTSTRPSRACGSSPTSSSTPPATCRGSTRSRSPATTCRRRGRRPTRSWPSPSPTASSTCATPSTGASTSTSSPAGSASSSPSA